jgi:hypothetical protein
MGFLDKAKQQAMALAEQAQAKLDEQQTKLNERAAATSSDEPVVRHDQHGRPIAADPAPEPPKPPQPPVAPPSSGPRPDDAPPTLSSGDPLKG